MSANMEWPIITMTVNIPVFFQWLAATIYLFFAMWSIIETRDFIGTQKAIRYWWLTILASLLWPLFFANQLSNQKLWPMNRTVRLLYLISVGYNIREARAVESIRRTTL